MTLWCKLMAQHHQSLSGALSTGKPSWLLSPTEAFTAMAPDRRAAEDGRQEDHGAVAGPAP